MAPVGSSADELVALVGGLSSVRMDDFAVVGSYMRFGEQVREQLKDARVRIAEACARPAKRRAVCIRSATVPSLNRVSDARMCSAVAAASPATTMLLLAYPATPAVTATKNSASRPRSLVGRVRVSPDPSAPTR